MRLRTRPPLLTYLLSLSQFVILLKRSIEHLMGHDCCPRSFQTLGLCHFPEVLVAWESSNQVMPWFCNLIFRLEDRHWSRLPHSLSKCMHALLGQG